MDAGSRWVFPIGLVWAQLMASAFVFERRLPSAVQEAPSRALQCMLLAGPLLSLLLLLWGRRLDRNPRDRSAIANAMVIVVLAFILAAHLQLLSGLGGRSSALHPGLPLSVGALLLALSGLIPRLPSGSPYGVKTPATCADERVWARVHRVFAGTMAGSGGLLIGAALLGWDGGWLALGLAPATLGLVWALAQSGSD